MARIRVETEYHDFYKFLADDDPTSSRRKIFATMKDVFMLALGFGVAKGQRTPLAGPREIFEDARLRQADWDIIKAAALSEDKAALVVLEDDAQLVRIAEEYANAGIRILKSEFLSAQPEQSLAAALLNMYKDTFQQP